MMGKRDFYLLGTSNAICAVCGFKRKRSEMKLRWDNVWCCREDWEIRQPQDFVRGLPEETRPDWTQPEVPDRFQEFTALAGGATYLGGAASLDANGQTVGVFFGNYVVGTPTVYVNGSVASGTLTIPAAFTFTSVPPDDSVLTWSGQWKDNAGNTNTVTNFIFGQGDGQNSTFYLFAY